MTQSSERIRELKSSGIIGSIIAALGSVALFGYLSGMETTYGWGHLTRMAFHTSAGFVCIGLGVLIFTWRRLSSGKFRVSKWLAAPACVGSVTIAIVLWQALDAQSSLSSTISAVVLLVGLFQALLITSPVSCPANKFK